MDESNANIDEKQEYVVAFANDFDDSRAKSLQWYYDKRKAGGMIQGRRGYSIRWTTSRVDASV